MSSVVFAVQGSTNARYSMGGSQGFAQGNVPPTFAGDATSIHGSSIQFSAANNVRCICWPGRLNTSNNPAFSVLVRMRAGYTGAPAASRQIISMSSLSGRGTALELIHSSTGSGTISVFARNDAASVCINSVGAGNFSPAGSTWNDIVFAWDGTTTGSSAKVYVNASMIGSGIVAAAAFAGVSNKHINEIQIGEGFNNGVNNADRFDEIVIWDYVIDPSNVALNSGNGALLGSGRLSAVAVAAYDGSDYTDPGISNVKSGTAYTFAGSSQVGTLAGGGGSGGAYVFLG